MELPHDWDDWTLAAKTDFFLEGAAWDLIQLSGAEPTTEAWERAMGAVRKIAAHVAYQRLETLEARTREP